MGTSALPASKRSPYSYRKLFSLFAQAHWIELLHLSRSNGDDFSHLFCADPADEQPANRRHRVKGEGVAKQTVENKHRHQGSCYTPHTRLRRTGFRNSKCAPTHSRRLH